MEIKIATTREDMEQVYRLRYQCYVEELGWKYDQADESAKELRDPMDASGTIYYVTVNGRMVATYCVHFGGCFQIPEKWRIHYALHLFEDFPESSFSFSSRLVVEPEMRNSMVVPRILMRAYEEARQRGCRFNFCYCRPRLIGLYERLGFIRYKDNILEPTQGYMVPMVLLGEDAAHLRAVNSPFHRICMTQGASQETATWFDRQFPGVRANATMQMLAPEHFWNEWAEVMSSDNSTLLQGFTQDQLKALLSSGTVLKCSAGDTMLREGEAGHEMFLILEGMARFAVQKANGGESQIGMASKGEIFGEVALVSKAKRSFTVQAVTNMQVLVISQDFLSRAMKSLPEIGMKLLFNLSHVLGQKLLTMTRQWQETVSENARMAQLITKGAQGNTNPPLVQHYDDRTVIIKKR